MNRSEAVEDVVRSRKLDGLAALMMASVAVLCVASPARADLVAYGGVVDLVATQGGLRAEHHHDWGKREAFVRLVDVEAGAEVLRLASPPLTTLWISPDGRYVVGLSQIMFENPDQIFIVSRDGSYRHSEGMRCSDARMRGTACMESVTNWVRWYDEANPGLRIGERGGLPVELAVNRFRPFGCSWPTPSRNEFMIEACLPDLPQLVIPLDR